MTREHLKPQLPGLPGSLKILSYNVQAGVETERYRDYVTKGWRHLLPNRKRIHNLNRISAILSAYDMVGLQEVDGGSLRSGFLDMTEYLAHKSGFPHWYHQVNRDIGVLAQHSNGYLSRFKPTDVTCYKLPAAPGRGAMLLSFGSDKEALRVCTMHLALSRRARSQQLGFLTELIKNYEHLVVMGDLNAGSEATEFKRFVENTGLQEPSCDQATFPSWRPIRKIDHILVSHALKISQTKVINYPLSDHLPISVEIELPVDAQQAA